MIGPVDPADRERVLRALDERFGIDPAVLEAYTFYAPADERVVLGPPEVPDGVEPVIGGLPAARLHGQVKPTTDFLQAFGRHATRNVVVLGRDAARAFVAREAVDLDRDDVDAGDATVGWVHVRYRDGRVGREEQDGRDGQDGRVFELGCGLLREDRLDSVVPKGRSVGLEHW